MGLPPGYRRWRRTLRALGVLGLPVPAGAGLPDLCADIAELRGAPPLFLVELAGPRLLQVVANHGHLIDVCQDGERHWAVDVVLRGPAGSPYSQAHGVRIVIPEDGWPQRAPLSVRFTTSIDHLYVDAEDTGEVRIAANKLFAGLSRTEAQHSLRAGLMRLHFALGGPLVPVSTEVAEAWHLFTEEHTQRLAPALAYTMRRAQTALFSHVWDDGWLDPRLRNALREDSQQVDRLGASPRPLSACSAAAPAKSSRGLAHEHFWCQQGAGNVLRRLAREVLPGVFEVPALSQSFVDALRTELENFLVKGVAPRRPNNHHRYGAIATDMGLESLMLSLLHRVAAPLARALFPREGAQLDAQHSFFVRYRRDQDTHLDNHHDDSDVTFNVALGVSSTSDTYSEEATIRGTDLHFCGLLGDPGHRLWSGSYRPQPGFAIVHLGRHRHGVMPIGAGERQSLIIWGRSSAWRRTAQGTYQREAKPPDPRCLSYTHDIDYTKYRQYPSGAAADARSAWCPPHGFEHAESEKLAQ